MLMLCYLLLVSSLLAVPCVEAHTCQYNFQGPPNGGFHMANWVRSSPFSERFSLGEHAKWRCDTPHKRCISAILARYIMKTRQNQGPLNGGFPDLDLSFLFYPLLSFLGLSRFFWDLPDLLGDSPDLSFASFSAYKSTYEEQSRKGPRHNLDLSRKKWETPRFSFPQNLGEAFLLIVGASLLTVKLLCSQSLKALLRRTFPL